MSIDLSHHLDDADDDNAAAQLVPLMCYLPINETDINANRFLC